MATYNVGITPDQKIVHVSMGADALPGGDIALGTFDHEPLYDADDQIDVNSLNHVLFHHVQEILYRTSKADPSEPAMFPFNITDMASLSIVRYGALINA